jgi:hypothetical protein
MQNHGEFACSIFYDLQRDREPSPSVSVEPFVSPFIKYKYNLVISRANEQIRYFRAT